MKPGSILEMLKEITSPYRNIWFLNKCNLQYFLDDEELVPSDETMIEKGITTGCQIKIVRKFNTIVTVEKKIMKCNLDDPVEELLWRYCKSNRYFTNYFVYLKKNGAQIDRSLTLREAGIVENDTLKVSFIHSGHEVNVSVRNAESSSNLSSSQCRIHIPPN